MTRFSHVDEGGRARMVDVGHKPPQQRLARARGSIALAPETVQLIQENQIKKGDVLTVAQLAGIQAAKQTGALIPLCHPLSLEKIAVEVHVTGSGVTVTSEVRCTGKTGVEMEALTAVSVALLAVYDMCKAVDKTMRLHDIELVEKKKEDLSSKKGETKKEARSRVMEKEKDRGTMAAKKMEVLSVNLSREKGTIKRPVTSATIDEEGLVGDAHAGPWHRQVSLLGQVSIDRFSQKAGRLVTPGEFAENLTLAGTDLGEVACLDRLTLGQVELEVTQIGKKCHGDNCAIFREVGQCAMPQEGIFARVLRGGIVKPGDVLEHRMRPFKVQVITLSDRASRGEYKDRSGPRISQLVEEFFAPTRWHLQSKQRILPDDATQLRAALQEAYDEGCDLVLTTGGTGLGPRDITPEVVTGFCQRLIPGVMEHIRLKYGAKKPNALLSRSVAGVAGTMQIYTLPGSVRAVNEYLAEIFLTLEHIVFMLHGLDIH